MPYWESLVTLSLGGAAVVGFLLLLYRLLLQRGVREIRGFCVWLKKFQRDWDGEPSAAGRDRVPGVMERLNSIDGELTRNGGSSLKDQVVQTWEMLQQFAGRVDVIEARQEEIQRLVESRLDSGNDREKNSKPQKA